MAARTGGSTHQYSSITKLLIVVGRPFYLLLLLLLNLLVLFFEIFGITFITIATIFSTLLETIGKPFVLLGKKITLFSLQKQVLNALSSLKNISFSLTKRKGKTRFFPKKIPSLHVSKVKRPSLTLSLFPRFPLLVSLSVTLFIAGIFTIYLPFLKDLPDPDSLRARQPALTTKILARDGTPLFEFYKDQNRTLVKLEDIPQNLKEATLSIEDKDFYTHGGLSYRGIIRALRRNLFDHKLQGGSTITQQLVKNTLLTREKTLERKIKEVILAILVEIKFDKDTILEMYFNEVAYGGTAYGAQAAAQMYFNKNVSDLNLTEAALIAGLPAAPTSFSPFGIHPELAKIRQGEVLRRMHEDGYIDATELVHAKNTPLHFAPRTINITAPHFVMYVKDLLVAKYGEQTVLQGGLEVTTTLDPVIQRQAEAAVRGEVQNLKRLNVKNGAALVTNPQTGEILSMVGSVDYFNFDNDGQVNVTLRPRQPGSSIKPINYALALENGFTPATIIPDTPICYRLPNQPAYCPRNYDNRFHGNVTLRQALASSYNVPAVKTLATQGVTNMIALGEKMGISTWTDPSRFGLSLTLGGGEVTMLDMAEVYGTLAKNGNHINLSPILKVTDGHGRLLEELACNQSRFPTVQAATTNSTCAGEKILNPTTAYQLTNILTDNTARAPAFGSRSVLFVENYPVAVKTGTTQNLRDNWTIGYTPNFVVLVWVGNNDNTPMSRIASGITGASPIWRRITDFMLAQKPPEPFIEPQGLIKVSVCTLTGERACAGCPVKEEYFVPGTEPKTACTPDRIEELKKKFEEANRDQILEGLSTP